MSAFKQKLARVTASVGVLACVTAAFLAVGGVGASGALASCSTTTTLEGQGSSLQKIAQTEIFAPNWAASGCGTGSNAKVSYVATSSGKGLAQWGYNGSGSVNTSIAIIGTDDGPNSSQISSARTAGKNANTVIVPVTQTAIAIVVHPPSGCTLTNITNANLESAFDGSAATWTALGGSGSSCSSSVTRVVRNEGSGTTYQFKNYLAKINGWTESEGSANETAICSKTTQKWSALEPIGPPPAEEPNTSWPECGSIAVTRAAGGGAVAETVAATAGTIGYASLPDAKAKGAQTVNVQDGVSGSKPVYAAPDKEGGANCSTAKYTLPANSTTGVNVDWSQVFGGNATIGGGTYPICTLTYDLGWNSYSTVGYASTVGAQVKAYYSFILSNKLGSTPKYYSNLPSNVQTAAETAVSKIS